MRSPPASSRAPCAQRVADQRFHRRQRGADAPSGPCARRVEPVADLQRLRARGEAFDESLVDALLHVVARRRDAHLAGVAILRADATDRAPGRRRRRRTPAPARGRRAPSSCASCRRAASFMSCLPTGTEPVNETARMTGRGDQMRRHFARHAEHDGQHALAASPASSSACATSSAEAGVSSAGFRMQVQPAPSAAPILRAGIAERKIPRREGGDRADRLLHHRHAHAGRALRQHAAVGAPAFFGVPVEDVRRGLHFDARLVNALAHLQRGDARDVFDAGAIHAETRPRHQPSRSTYTAVALACSTGRGPSAAAASRACTRIGAATGIIPQTLTAHGTLANVSS